MIMLNPITTLLTILPLLVILLCDVSQTIYSKINLPPKGLSLKMTHINDHYSPMYQPELTDEETSNRSLRISESRMSYKPNMLSEMNRQDLLYYVEIGIGLFENYDEPVHKIYLVFDTGSDVIWTQCEGCRKCFKQKNPNFPKSRSLTYHPHPCGQCRGPCHQNHCEYTVTYHDGRQMNGTYADELFTFGYEIFSRPLKFVCGMETSSSFPDRGKRGTNNIISGVLGMGRGSDSLISQLGTEGQNKFSFCFRNCLDSDTQHTMYLTFGMHVLDQNPSMSVTQILGHHEFLFVGLIGISVGEQRLNIPMNAFRLRSDYSGGTIIDTGSAVTHLVSSAFDSLVNEISSYIQRYNRQDHIRQYTNKPSNLEACWEPLFDNPPMYLPKVTFHFPDDVNMIIEKTEVFATQPVSGIPAPGLTCLAMYRDATSDLNIIGAKQLINQRVIVNLQTLQFSFVTADCSRENW